MKDLQKTYFFQPENHDNYKREKYVKDYSIMNPMIKKGKSAYLHYAKRKEDGAEMAMKIYDDEWEKENNSILKNECRGITRLGKLDIGPKSMGGLLSTKAAIYIPMEYCNGGNLNDFLGKEKFPDELLREIAIFLCTSLQKLSEHQIVVRDISPRHILVNITEKKELAFKLIGAKYCAFLGKEEEPIKYSGDGNYAAPEVLSGSKVDYAADMWSMGITLCHLAKSELKEKNSKYFIDELQKGKDLKAILGVGINPALGNLIQQCMVLDPSKRIKGVEALSHPFIKGGPFPIIKQPLQEDVKQTEVYGSPPAKEAFPEEKKARKLITPIESLKKIFKKNPLLFYNTVIEEEEGKIEIKKIRPKEKLDPYEIIGEEPLSQGGFSEIFKCRDKEGKICVLKIVKTSKIKSVKVGQLVLGEINTMLVLKESPFTIKIMDYFMYKNDLCLVIEYCNGGDLDKHIKDLYEKKKYMGIEDIRMAAHTIAQGLLEMHKLKFIHRDIKPKNILLIKSETPEDKILAVKLCDFGLSKNAQDEELKGSTVVGTMEYFAPEICLIMKKIMNKIPCDLKYDSKVDVWSYGILLYCAAYGKTPAKMVGSKTKVMKDKKIEFPSDIPIDSLLRDLIEKCLCFAPEKRPTFDEILKHPFFFPTPLGKDSPSK